MAAATATYVPLEVYLSSSYEPDAEYVDGVIEERPMGEDDHSAWQDAIAAWFRSQTKTAQIRVRPELRVQISATHFRVPDVALIDRNLPQQPIAAHPPVAVFEVLSPEDSLRKLTVRCLEYERMGIQTILVIDPQGPTYRFVSGRLEPLQARAFDLPGSHARFDLDEIEKLLD